MEDRIKELESRLAKIKEPGPGIVDTATAVDKVISALKSVGALFGAFAALLYWAFHLQSGLDTATTDIAELEGRLDKGREVSLKKEDDDREEEKSRLKRHMAMMQKLTRLETLLEIVPK